MSKAIKQKVTLDPSPTFPATVKFQTAGGKTAEIEFIFKHRTKDQLKEFSESLKVPEVEEGETPIEGPKDADVLMDIASGWDLDDPFDAKSLTKLAQNYIGSVQAVVTAYFAELSGARVKN